MRVLRCLCIIALVISACPAGAGEDGQTEVIAIDIRGFETLLGRAEGRVLLVNIWATWCLPCVEEFPDLLKLRETYRDKGLEVAFISIDDPRSLKHEVMPFLRRMGVSFPTYIKDVDDDEAFINAIYREWSGAVPATFVYDRKGKISSFLIEARTFTELSEVVGPLLEGNP